MPRRARRAAQNFRQRIDRFGDQSAVRDFREQAALFPLWAKAA
jgi:hypothetical protein